MRPWLGKCLLPSSPCKQQSTTHPLCQKDLTRSSQSHFLLTDLERLSPLLLSAKTLEFPGRKTKTNQLNKKTQKNPSRKPGNRQHPEHVSTQRNPQPQLSGPELAPRKGARAAQVKLTGGHGCLYNACAGPRQGERGGGTAPQVGVNIYVH